MNKEACGFRDSWGELQRRNVVVLGISPGGGATHEKFAAKYHLPFILLSDPDKSVMQQYGAFGEKVMCMRLKPKRASFTRFCPNV